MMKRLPQDGKWKMETMSLGLETGDWSLGIWYLGLLRVGVGSRWRLNLVAAFGRSWGVFGWNRYDNVTQRVQLVQLCSVRISFWVWNGRKYFKGDCRGLLNWKSIWFKMFYILIVLKAFVVYVLIKTLHTDSSYLPIYYTGSAFCAGRFYK